MVKEEEETKCVSQFHPKISLPSPLRLRLPLFAQGKPFHLGFPPKQPSVTLRSQFNSNAERKERKQALISPTDVNYRNDKWRRLYKLSDGSYALFWRFLSELNTAQRWEEKKEITSNFLPSCTQWFWTCVWRRLMVPVRETSFKRHIRDEAGFLSQPLNLATDLSSSFWEWKKYISSIPPTAM